ncbi:hypothetical protein COB57_02520 [Candidatus Peregrinibacteria bacterium]|nr:MAG: hypothetical protein COB57_02520 [Candidatus Peregrinibacteria bacterium]
MKNKGFTLVELIIVIAIISVLATLAFMSFSTETAQARDAKRDNDIKVFEDAISTSNSKDKPIRFTKDFVGKTDGGVDRADDSATTTVTEGPDTHVLQSSSGSLKAIRGGYLLPVQTGVFDSGIMQTVANDPKGNPYLVAFVSKTDYLFLASKENPTTKITTAMVKGTFKPGATLDSIREQLTGGASAATTIKVSNPTRFVAGDVVRIDDEYMVVRGYDETLSTLSVVRGYDLDAATGVNISTQAVHNIGADIKLYQPATKGDSLACLIEDIADLATISSDSTGVNTYIGTFAFPGIVGTAGKVCGTNSNSIIDGGTILPYNL